MRTLITLLILASTVLGQSVNGILNQSVASSVLISTSGPVTDSGNSNSWQFNNSSGAITFNIRAGVVGYSRCYFNSVGKTGAITIQLPASNTVSLNGVDSTVAGTIFSLGALGDFICLKSDATNHWIVESRFGTWSVTPNAPTFITMVSDQGPRAQSYTPPATVQYASPTGSGSACTVVGTPCTFATAFSAAIASGSVKTVVMRGGTYAQGGTLTIDQTANGVTIEAYLNTGTGIYETPVLDFQTTRFMVCQSCANMNFYGLTFARLAANTGSGTNSGIFFNGNGGSDPTNIQFRWDTFDTYADNALYAYIASGLVFSDNICKTGSPANNGSGFNYACITVPSVGANTGAPQITHNYFHDLVGTAVIAGSMTGTVVDRNILINVETSGASDMGAIYFQDVTVAKTGLQITNNYIKNNAGSGIASQVKGIYLDSSGTNGGPGTSNVTITGNYITGGCGQFCWQASGGNHVTISGNWFDVSPAGTATLGLYQSAGVSGGSTGGMLSNSNTGNVYYSTTTFPGTLYQNNLNGADVEFTNSGNLYYSVNSSTIPNTTPVDTAPVYSNPGSVLINFLPTYLQ